MPDGKCKICGFGLVDGSGLCSYHSQTHTSCRKCEEEAVQKPETYCVNCVAASRGRCTNCFTLIGQSDEVHLLKEPHIHSVGRFICMKCYREMKPLANISIGELDKIAGKIISWPPKVAALNDFVAKMYPVVWKKAHKLSAESERYLTEIVKTIGSFQTPVVITTYPWFIPKKYSKGATFSAIQSIAFTGGTSAHKVQRSYFSGMLSPVSVIDGLSGASGWPYNMLGKISSYFSAMLESEFKESVKILGEALWHPTRSQMDGTLWICEEILPTIYEAFMKVHNSKRKMQQEVQLEQQPGRIDAAFYDALNIAGAQDWYLPAPPAIPRQGR